MTGPRPGTPAEATTPGQRAYTAWWATAKGVPKVPDVTYDQDAEAWDASAQAVLNQAFPGLKRERDEARAEVDRVFREHVLAEQQHKEIRDGLREERDAIQAERDQLHGELTAARRKHGTDAALLHRYLAALQQVASTAEYFSHKGELDIALAALGDGGTP